MVKALRFIVSALILFAANTSAQQMFYPENLQQSDFVQGAIIFKLKDSYLEKLGDGLNTEKFEIELNIEGIADIRQSFPKVQKPQNAFDRAGRKYADLRGIGTMQHTGNKPLKRVLFELVKSGYFEWVQPRFVQRPMFTPNDPQIAQQYHHALIKTFEAFDIEQGDTNVYIGITDAGIQFEHQDLGNVRYNYADPVNGLDDDNNGYIDDFRGWNTASNTNNPTATLSPHGMFTTGMSSATVNNGIGVAGNAYRCKFVPVRIDDANGFTFGYEGIVYLAELGCKFINASWGGTFPDPFGEEIIRYATVNKEALVVAAAGNSGINEKYYPASYEGVFSVAATGAADIAWSGSTFGPRVDICAPGELVRSCWPFNGYDVSSGTSFSAPLVTGAAALVKSHFPWRKLQMDSTWFHCVGNGCLHPLPELHAQRHSQRFI
jgi:subtilisin family serine protease